MTMAQEKAIWIYSEAPATPRLRYAATSFFSTVEDYCVIFTSSTQEIINAPGILLAYGSSPNPEIPLIPAVGLLFETGINDHKPDITFLEEVPVMYATDHPGALVSFDVFAATFWLLSRYEEYQPFKPDVHGRFPASQSLLFRFGLLRKPLVDIWRQFMISRLMKKYPGAELHQKHFRFVPTIDIDSAWAYRHKPCIRSFGGVIKAFLYGKLKEAAERIAVLAGLKPDPFDTYTIISEIHKDTVTPVFFFLLGKYNRYNKNQHPANRHYRALILSLCQNYLSGIHPSYETSNDKGETAYETALLRDITGNAVIRSRQHFLRFSLPGTYRHLQELGIGEEYSMGFAAEPGFRAGTCNPFKFYDLISEKELPLLIYPITVMDGTLRDYLSLNPVQATDIIRELADVVYHNNGMFVSLWHNESLDGSARWKGWTPVYRYLVNYCSGFSGRIKNSGTDLFQVY